MSGIVEAIKEPDSLTNVGQDELSLSSERTDAANSLERLDNADASVVMTDSAAMGAGDAGDDVDNLDPLGNENSDVSKFTSGNGIALNGDRSLVSAAM